MTLHAKQKLLLHISVGISVGSPGDRIFANVDLLHVSSLLHHNVSVMPQQCLARVSSLAHTGIAAGKFGPSCVSAARERI